MKVSGSVRFKSQPERVYEHLARGVLAHALEGVPEESVIHERSKVVTRYQTKLWLWTVVTTEEASLEPGRSITWRHLEGPLIGSVETFRLEASDGETEVRYEGQIRARSRVFRGPGERLFVGPLTRKVSLGALKKAREELEGS